MSSVGYTIFGRPVQHDYVSNGLFNELNLNSETYLPVGIDLKKGGKLAILKRYKDNNGIEVTVALLYTIAVSLDGRVDGYVGAGIAFIGQPSTILIYHRLKQLDQQSLSLLESNNFKFKSPKINTDQIKLPDLSEDGIFLNRKPRNYKAGNTIIGIKFTGQLYESLMSAIQGFALNESYYGVKTAYFSDDDEFLKRNVASKYIYQTHNLFDYYYVYKKYNDLIIEKQSKIDQEIESKRQSYKRLVDEKEIILNQREESITRENQKLDEREQNIKRLEDNKKHLENEIISLENKINDLEKEINKLRKLKNDLLSQQNNLKNSINSYKKNTFREALNNPDFRDERKAFEENIKREYKEELEGNRKTDWLKVLFALMSVLFLISTIVVSYFAFIKKTEIPKFVDQNVEIPESKNLPDNLNISFPNPITANEFLDKDKEEQEEHIREINTVVELLSDDAYKAFIDNYEVISNRPWNFREVLTNNVPEDIDKGLERLVRIKKLPSIKDTTLFYKPRFLLNQIDNQDTMLDEIKIEITSDNKKDVLKHYIERDNNIYDKLGIKYKKPKEGMNYQDSDPVLLMHFRWMIFNYKDQKKDINKLKKGDIILVPVLK